MSTAAARSEVNGLSRLPNATDFKELTTCPATCFLSLSGDGDPGCESAVVSFTRELYTLLTSLRPSSIDFGQREITPAPTQSDSGQPGYISRIHSSLLQNLKLIADLELKEKGIETPKNFEDALRACQSYGVYVFASGGLPGTDYSFFLDRDSEAQLPAAIRATISTVRRTLPPSDTFANLADGRQFSIDPLNAGSIASYNKVSQATYRVLKLACKYHPYHEVLEGIQVYNPSKAGEMLDEVAAAANCFVTNLSRTVDALPRIESLPPYEEMRFHASLKILDQKLSAVRELRPHLILKNSDGTIDPLPLYQDSTDETGRSTDPSRRDAVTTQFFNLSWGENDESLSGIEKPSSKRGSRFSRIFKRGSKLSSKSASQESLPAAVTASKPRGKGRTRGYSAPAKVDPGLLEMLLPRGTDGLSAFGRTQSDGCIVGPGSANA